MWSQQRLQLNQALLRQCLDGRPKPVIWNMLCAVTPKKTTIAPNQNTRRWPSSKIDFIISPYTAVLFSGWSVIIGHLVCSGYPVGKPQDTIWMPYSALKLHRSKLQTRVIRRSLHPNFIGCPEAHFESSGSLRLVVFSLFKGTRKYLAGFRLAASKPTSSMISCQRTWCPHSDLNRERALIWSHGVPTYKVGVLPVKL